MGSRPENWDDAKRAYSEIAGTAAALVPVYRHRYIPIIDGVDDPPVLSIASGFDIVFYGSNLEDYLQREFVEPDQKNRNVSLHIPFWSNIMSYNGSH